VQSFLAKVATAQAMVLSLRFMCIANQKGGSSIVIVEVTKLH